DVLECFLVSFELFGGRNVQDGLFGALLGLLGIGIGLFEVSNSSKLCAKGIKPRNTRYVIGIEVTHMLGDGCVGVHHWGL
ncbi:hypothetical protein, partial [Hafnia paralvei]|uniref:hypothetical protein n=1 Tax=Hafnia paralvei TaxID=546367 RepID=UPI0029DC6D82|nr:hypothetical protein [Hafnia paralvei]